MMKPADYARVLKGKRGEARLRSLKRRDERNAARSVRRGAQRQRDEKVAEAVDASFRLLGLNVAGR